MNSGKNQNLTSGLAGLLPEEIHGPGSMSPRERVLAAINHREPDRVPADFWAVPEVIKELKEFFGVADEWEICRKLAVDVRTLVPDVIGPRPRNLDDDTFVDIWGVTRRRVSNKYSVYEEYVNYPLGAAQKADDVEKHDWPDRSWWDFEGLRSKLARLDGEGEYCIKLDIGGVFETAWSLTGFEKFLVDLAVAPEVPCAVMDKVTDVLIEYTRAALDVIGDRVDLVYTYDDIAHQSGLLFSPQTWREYILPRHLRLNEVIKGYGVKIMYHSCGAVRELIPELIDMGIDVLNPLQPRAAGMDMRKIKRQFGDRLAFHGAIDIQHTLPKGSPGDVEREVADRIDVLGRGGGYILASAHYIQADTPVENILALYSAQRTVPTARQ